MLSFCCPAHQTPFGKIFDSNGNEVAPKGSKLFPRAYFFSEVSKINFDKIAFPGSVPFHLIAYHSGRYHRTSSKSFHLLWFSVCGRVFTLFHHRVLKLTCTYIYTERTFLWTGAFPIECCTYICIITIFKDITEFNANNVDPDQTPYYGMPGLNGLIFFRFLFILRLSTNDLGNSYAVLTPTYILNCIWTNGEDLMFTFGRRSSLLVR